MYFVLIFFCIKQKTADEMRISDWSSDVCSSDLFGLAMALPNSKFWSAIARSKSDRLIPISTLICGRNRPNDWRTAIASVTMKAEQAMTTNGRFRGERDRKRAGEGQGVAGSVESGGRRRHKKKQYSYMNGDNKSNCQTK